MADIKITDLQVTGASEGPLYFSPPATPTMRPSGELRWLTWKFGEQHDDRSSQGQRLQQRWVEVGSCGWKPLEEWRDVPIVPLVSV